MARSYYSTVFEQAADEIWAVIRDFGHYSWAGVGGDTHIEEEKAGDAVGSIRNVRFSDKVIRQRLLAHSDIDRFYTYEFCGSAPFPVHNYQATLRVTPIIDGSRAFVEWWATFDCPPEEQDYWTHYFTNDGFAKWLQSLRDQWGQSH